jgi:hypothetical protein
MALRGSFLTDSPLTTAAVTWLASANWLIVMVAGLEVPVEDVGVDEAPQPAATTPKSNKSQR